MEQKTKKETNKLKTAKVTYKSLKVNHPTLWRDLRDSMIKEFVKMKTPEWGGLKFNITQKGV